MRAALVSPVTVKVRRLKPAVGDVLGDAPVLVSREAAFSMPMQVDRTRGMLGESGVPGRDARHTATALALRRDVPPEAAGWSPGSNDLVELPDGSKLFVTEAHGAFPTSRRFGSDGGFDGWRISLTDRSPDMRAATSY